MTDTSSRLRRALSQASASGEGRRHLAARAREEAGARVIRFGRAARVRMRLPVRMPGLPPFEVPEGPVNRPGLRVAVVLDGFTELALRYEWEQVRVTPSGWHEELAGDPPALLFVESAWNGNGGAWRLAMSTERGPSEELQALVAWCREEGIPTVFWNKEDPPNYDRFIETAKLFDQVFTVDADRLPAYRRDLGHERVALLPFGAQPRIHTPIVRGSGRVREVAFAGSYFAEKHPERREQMDYVLDPVRDLGLHIYSRMQGGDRRYRFPSRYHGNLVGSLPYERMLAAFTQYKVFLNVNSVTQSPTMCARRLFELSAAQTAVVTAPAASVPNFFGDDLTVVHDAEDTRTAVTVLLKQDEYRDRIGLRAHRRVFDEHLYRHRVDTVLHSVGLPVRPLDQSISAVVATMRPGQLDHVLDYIGAQRHKDVELVLVTHGFTADPVHLARRGEELDLKVQVVEAGSELTLGACMNLGVERASGRYVAKMDDDNIYTEYYLQDLVRAFEFTDAAVVGKWAHYVHLQATGANLLRFGHAEHRYVSLVQGGTILTPRETAVRLRFEDLPRRVDTTFLDKVRAEGGLVYSADRFNFVSVRTASPGNHTWGVSDGELLSRMSDLVFYGDPREHVTV